MATFWNVDEDWHLGMYLSLFPPFLFTVMARIWDLYLFFPLDFASALF